MKFIARKINRLAKLWPLRVFVFFINNERTFRLVAYAESALCWRAGGAIMPSEAFIRKF